MYRIFIIGAGFSRPAGLPLGDELWGLILNEAHSEYNFYDLLISDVQSYLAYNEKVYGQKINVENIEIEDFISYLDVEHFLRLRGSDTFSESGNRGQIIVKNLIAKIIFKKQKSIPCEVLKLYDKFCSSLDETDIIISFNYDTLVEDTLTRINKPFRLFPNRMKSVHNGYGTVADIKEIVLLKMHGSINWFDKTPYDEICSILKRNGASNPYDVRGNIFSNSSVLDMNPLIKGPYFSNSPMNNIYTVNDLNKYFNNYNLLLNSPLIISPSFSKMVYLNPIKSFWDSFREAGMLNSALNVIGFSFSNHDKYLMQAIVNIIVNFQEYNQFDQFFMRKKVKQQKLTVVDNQKDECHKSKFKQKLKFIDWSNCLFITNGFDKDAIHEIFNSK